MLMFCCCLCFDAELSAVALPCLIDRDKKFKQYVDLYAKDEETFFKVSPHATVAGLLQVYCI